MAKSPGLPRFSQVQGCHLLYKVNKNSHSFQKVTGVSLFFFSPGGFRISPFPFRNADLRNSIHGALRLILSPFPPVADSECRKTALVMQ